MCEIDWIHPSQSVDQLPTKNSLSNPRKMTDQETTTTTSSSVPMVTLVSLDDAKFTLPVEAAKESEMVSNALGLGDDEDEDEDDDEDEEDDGNKTSKKEVKSVDLLKVTSRCLEQVVEFLKHYHEEKMNEIPMPLPGNNFDEVRLFLVVFL